MKQVILDGRLLDSREAFHETVARELGFPDWYGNNLDALYDCLTDLEEETVICLLHPDAMKEKLGDYGGKVLAALLEAGQENPALHICLELKE